jgi:hypothetical protein
MKWCLLIILLLSACHPVQQPEFYDSACVPQQTMVAHVEQPLGCEGVYTMKQNIPPMVNR